MKIPALIICLLLSLLSAPAFAEDAGRMWIYFTDKGFGDSEEITQALLLEEARLLPRARARLQKVRPAGALICETDLPVCADYLMEIERLTGRKPHVVSRWLNAASYQFDQRQLQRIRELDFIEKVRPVKSFAADYEEPQGIPANPLYFRSTDDSLSYGGSYTQNSVHNFIDAHNAGFSGAGVLVGMLDAGWNNLGHVCFDSLEIIATWDFVNGDSSVADDIGQMGSGSHGTKTLSALAGFDNGSLIGAAYGVSVALAKTENTESELPIEEDNWAAGIEWLDSLGVEIASSSVSYAQFQGEPPIPYEMRDGNSTVITIAADYAVQRGIIVLNSMSNNGGDPYPEDKMNVPADGDSVLSIGACGASGYYASFSSIGPTYDGRIKPDLLGFGVSARVANPYSATGYTNGSGTSYSTPITAGACALILEADPLLTPMEVHAFLKASGNNAADPDTISGWGCFYVWQAIQEVLAAAVPQHTPIPLPADFAVSAPYPNPFNNVVTVPFALSASGEVKLSFYNVHGELIDAYSRWFPAGYHYYQRIFEQSASGIYFFQAEALGRRVMKKVVYLK